MRARRGSGLGRRAVGLLVAGAVLVGCGAGGSGGSDGEALPSWCASLSLVDRVLDREDRSIRELVDADEWDENHLGAAAALALVGADGGGSFGPLLDHLIERHGATIDGTEPPVPTDEVRDLAAQADRELGKGACG